MRELAIIMTASWLAGITAFIGASIARYEGTADTEAKQFLIRGVVALGGGILVAAIAFALAPDAIEILNPFMLVATFCLGGVAFCILDAHLARRGGAASQFMAMLMDFLPEAISLGAIFVHNHREGILLALFIGAQNLPEGFNAFRELVSSGRKPRRILTAIFAISFLGPVAAALGYFLLRHHEQWTAGIMSFAAGGILYLVFQDIAPQSTMRKHWVPPLGAILGFVIGMLGKKLIG